MKIVKQNETFNLTDATELYETSGTVTYEANGSISVHFNVRDNGGNYIGDGHYSKYGDEGQINFGVNCSEANREAITAYADSVIDYVLSQFVTEE